jgi:hypothetical protein
MTDSFIAAYDSLGRLPPEAEYMLRLLRSVASGDAAAPEAPPGLDWTRLERLLDAHGVTGTVVAWIARSSAPASVRRSMEQRWAALRRSDALLQLELARVVGALERQGVRPVVLKGPALARTVYTSPALRTAGDVDLLVAPESVDRSCAALADLGYEPAFSKRHRSFYLDHHFHVILHHPSGRVVEVHWDLSRPRDYFRFDIAGFLARTRLTDAGGTTLQVPSDADQLLHSACQGVRQGFADLRRVVDAALLLRRDPGDGLRLAASAASQGIAPALWLLLELERALIGVEPPTALVAALRPRAFRRRCIESLSLGQRLVSLELRSAAGLRRLVFWLCAPGPASLLVEMRRFVAPGAAEFLDEGHDPDRLPGALERVRIGFRRSLSLVRILAHQGSCLVRG